MAKIIKNEKGFKVIEISRNELIEKLGHLGSLGECDSCLSTPDVGYYVAVMNTWLCPKCYKEFINRSEYNSSDQYIETRNFNYYKRIFNLDI